MMVITLKTPSGETISISVDAKTLRVEYGLVKGSGPAVTVYRNRLTYKELSQVMAHLADGSAYVVVKCSSDGYSRLDFGQYTKEGKTAWFYSTSLNRTAGVLLHALLIGWVQEGEDHG